MKRINLYKAITLLAALNPGCAFSGEYDFEYEIFSSGEMTLYLNCNQNQLATHRNLLWEFSKFQVYEFFSEDEDRNYYEILHKGHPCRFNIESMSEIKISHAWSLSSGNFKVDFDNVFFPAPPTDFGSQIVGNLLDECQEDGFLQNGRLPKWPSLGVSLREFCIKKITSILSSDSYRVSLLAEELKHPEVLIVVGRVFVDGREISKW